MSNELRERLCVLDMAHDSITYALDWKYMASNSLEILRMYLLPFSVFFLVAILIWLMGMSSKEHANEDSKKNDSSIKPTEPAKVMLLIVDDSIVARTKLRKLFEVAGYDIVESADGLEAMACLEKNKNVSVMITDLEMPNMNGLELIAAVQGGMSTEDIPIVAITGNDDMQARVNDVSGLYGIFKKPWNDRELLKRVGKLTSIRTFQTP